MTQFRMVVSGSADQMSPQLSAGLYKTGLVAHELRH